MEDLNTKVEADNTGSDEVMGTYGLPTINANDEILPCKQSFYCKHNISRQKHPQRNMGITKWTELESDRPHLD